MMKPDENIIFGKFQIIECLKKDEHSAVYLANHSYLSKKIILKSLNVGVISDKEKIERFKREARILASLDHTNIIKVLDFGTADDYFYISFEYFESENLRRFISLNKLSESDKEKLMDQLLEGLNYAHSKGIVHRDLKPENILVNKNLQLKISDFGLAFSEDDDLVTAQYSVLGTPSYMSPEQVRGERLSQNSDLFSAGIVLLELFTGNNPFRGEDISDSINKIINYEETDLTDHLTLLPPGVQPIIQALLKKMPGERNVLRSKNQNSAAYNKPEKRNKIYKWIAGAVTLILISVYSFLYLFNGKNVSETKYNLNNLPVSNTSEENPITFRDSVTRIPVDHREELFSNNKERDNSPELLSNTETDEVTPETASITQVETEEKATRTGFLQVECIPWAEVEINSEFVDVTPFDSPVEVPAGNAIIKFTHPDYPPLFRKVILEQGVLNKVEINLNKEFGFVFINVYPWGRIYINNKYFGETPLTDAMVLPPGEYNITIRNQGYLHKVDTIIVEKGDTLILNYNLTPEQL